MSPESSSEKQREASAQPRPALDDIPSEARALSRPEVNPPKADGTQRAEFQSEGRKPDPLATEKEVAFYGAVVNAFITTKMEYDRTLLAFSIAGIGLFFTLMTTVGPRSVLDLWLYGIGTFGFGVATLTGLRIFLRNADFMTRLATEPVSTADPVLKKLDRRLARFFALGALAAVLAGGSAAYEKYKEKNSGGAVSMDTRQAPRGENRSQSPTSLPQEHAKPEILPESLDGFEKLRPPKPATPIPDKPTKPPTSPKKP
jgi:hypothetical protein